MTESETPSLADRALQRLRKIAAGNGLEPAAIAILDKQEETFTLTGAMDVSPVSEVETRAYPGPAHGQDVKIMGNAAALQQAVAQHQQKFRESRDWLPTVATEIKAHATQGWGLDGAKVVLEDKSALFAATELCPRCEGRQTLTCDQCAGEGDVVCTQCQGQGRELCYYCGGRGENPHQPGQRCATCNGTRYAPCRFCQTRGRLTCPTCHGNRGMPCTDCRATGRITQEVHVTCSAETAFKMKADALPSGLRRGLDRLGVAQLGAAGHADIVVTPPPKDEDSPPPEKPPYPLLIYTAKLPYAEMRMGFAGKKAMVSAVGKRCALIGVPAFLDETLQPWRGKLRQAALGKAPLDDALDVRALRDILALAVSGKGRIDEVRKLYPFGLSSDAITVILADMRLALNAATLKTRAALAALCVAAAAVLFRATVYSGVLARGTAGWNSFLVFAVFAAVLGAALAAAWAALNFATRLVLKRRFPQLTVSLQQKIGKTGMAMLSGVALAFLIFLFTAPVKPVWMLAVLR